MHHAFLLSLALLYISSTGARRTSIENSRHPPSRISARSNLPSLSDNFESNDILCPGQQNFNCPNDNTCCQGPGNIYGCCPQRNAVCCPDREHCCPHGYRCDQSGEKCIYDGTLESVAWLAKLPAISLHNNQPENLSETKLP